MSTHEDQQADEDAIAYLYSEKMRRDDGETIDDDDTVDLVFGERSNDRPAAAGSAQASGLAAFAVLAGLAFAALLCWLALTVH
jgi:hypothetical protein